MSINLFDLHFNKLTQNGMIDTIPTPMKRAFIVQPTNSFVNRSVNNNASLQENQNNPMLKKNTGLGEINEEPLSGTNKEEHVPLHSEGIHISGDFSLFNLKTK